jgi:hypothetical protein
MKELGSIKCINNSIRVFWDDRNGVRFLLREISPEYDTDPAECFSGIPHELSRQHMISLQKDDTEEHYVSPIGLSVIASNWGDDGLCRWLTYQVMIPLYSGVSVNAERLNLLSAEQAKSIRPEGGLLRSSLQ